MGTLAIGNHKQHSFESSSHSGQVLKAAHIAGKQWALFNGASVNSVLNAADWSHESTFIRLYLCDMSATVLDS